MVELAGEREIDQGILEEKNQYYKGYAIKEYNKLTKLWMLDAYRQQYETFLIWFILEKMHW